MLSKIRLWCCGAKGVLTSYPNGESGSPDFSAYNTRLISHFKFQYCNQFGQAISYSVFEDKVNAMQCNDVHSFLCQQPQANKRAYGWSYVNALDSQISFREYFTMPIS
jgi:hypothetical protein